MSLLFYFFILAGTPEVINPPTHKGVILNFIEDLSFGADEDNDKTSWSMASTSISVDDRGHMFIVDTGENRVLEFDVKGSYISTVISEGIGPGEAQGLREFQILADGSAMAMELVATTAKLHRFDRKMAFVSRHEDQLILERASISPNGKHLAGFFVAFDPASQTTHYRTALLDTSFKVVHGFSLGKGPLPDRSRLADPSYWANRIGENIKRAAVGMGVFCFDGKGRLYSAPSHSYEVTRWSADNKQPELVVKRKYKPILRGDAETEAMVENLTADISSDPFLSNVITPSVIDRAVTIADLPPNKNPIFGMLVLEDGHLLVIHDVNLISGESTADIFSPKGIYIGQIKRPNYAFLRRQDGLFMSRMVFKGGFAYTVETDEMGDNRAKRYRLEWQR